MNQFRTSITLLLQRTDYVIGSDLLANLDKIEDLKAKKFSSYLLLSDTTIFKLYGDRILASLKKIGIPVITSLVEPGEKHKEFSEISKVIGPYFKAGFDRESCLVALGGGVITDLGGFVASILLRGIDAIYLPTTLLGQIDAAIGGKTGVDLALNNLMLKNMIGTITQPSMVISDIDVLSTLPEREIMNGLGEMLKYWAGWGKPKVDKILKIKNKKDGAALAGIISECQRIKLDIISRDPFETKGFRQKLNLGHTIGHAIEAAAQGKLSHGEAVSIGLAACTRISVLKGFLAEDKYKMIINQLKLVGLPTVARNIDTQKVVSALKLDKKGGTLVLIKDIGNIVTGVNVEQKIINKVLTEVIV